MEKHQVMNIKW